MGVQFYKKNAVFKIGPQRFPDFSVSVYVIGLDWKKKILFIVSLLTYQSRLICLGTNGAVIINVFFLPTNASFHACFNLSSTTNGLIVFLLIKMSIINI